MSVDDDSPLAHVVQPNDVITAIDSRKPNALKPNAAKTNTQQGYRRDEPTLYVQHVRAIWDRIIQAQEDVLRNTTLADLVQQDQGIQYVI